MKRYVKIVLWIAMISILVGIGYGQLGGFRPVELALTDCRDFEFVGVEFKGTPQDERLPLGYRQVEDAVLDNPNAILHTIYYEEPAGKRDTMHVFVGIEEASLRKPIPSMVDKRVPCRRAIVARIFAHRFAMPNPSQIKKKIREFALSEGVLLQELFVDRILDDSHVEVWAPLIEEQP